MKELGKSCAGPVGAGTGAELKADSFCFNQYPLICILATAMFYWDADSNSVQPWHDRVREVL